jgi:preprotein translocase subunit Sec61beta
VEIRCFPPLAMRVFAITSAQCMLSSREVRVALKGLLPIGFWRALLRPFPPFTKYFYILSQVGVPIDMAKESKTGGFQSAAGLIRYFDSEDEKALKLSPYVVIALCAITVAVVVVANALFPT